MGRLARGLAACVLAASASAGALEADEAADALKQAAALRQERIRLEREVGAKLHDQLRQIREQMMQQADMGNLRVLVAKAQKAYDERVKSDEQIAASARAQEAAAKAAAEAEAAAMAKDPVLTRLKKDHAAAEQAEEEADFQERLARFMLSEIRRRVTEVPEVRARRDASYRAARAVRDLVQKTPKIAAAEKAAYEARKAYEAKLHSLPEYAAMVRAQEAYEARIKTIPERAAMAQAREAYEALMEADEAVRAAAAARDAARRAYEDEVDLALAADAVSAEQTEKLKKARADQQAARTQSRELHEKIRDAERAIRTKSPEVLEARKAHEAARKAHADTLADRAAGEQDALKKLQDEIAEKVRRKLASDPRAQLLQEELDKIGRKIEEIRERYHALERQAREKRKAPATQ